MSSEAYVTLATNDGYAVGALVLGHSLLSVGTSKNLCILITPNVSDPVRAQLATVFHDIVVVDVLDSKDSAHLALMKRPELGVTFTKIHCWNLSQFSKCVFLDADMLAVQNPDELFKHNELSAACDVGWPDCFNSGMFVYSPSQETYSKLIEHASKEGSFDGGDQGLLNTFFPNWNRISFTFNMVVSATYSYLPAYKQFGSGVKLVHFLGIKKPWQHPYDPRTGQVATSPGSQHMVNYLNSWWNIYNRLVHPALPSLDIQKEAEMKAPIEIVNPKLFLEGLRKDSGLRSPKVATPTEMPSKPAFEKEVKKVHYQSPVFSVVQSETKKSDIKSKDTKSKQETVLSPVEKINLVEKKETLIEINVEEQPETPTTPQITSVQPSVETTLTEESTKIKPVNDSKTGTLNLYPFYFPKPYEPYHPYLIESYVMDKLRRLYDDPSSDPAIQRGYSSHPRRDSHLDEYYHGPPSPSMREGSFRQSRTRYRSPSYPRGPSHQPKDRPIYFPREPSFQYARFFRDRTQSPCRDRSVPLVDAPQYYGHVGRRSNFRNRHSLSPHCDYREHRPPIRREVSFSHYKDLPDYYFGQDQFDKMNDPIKRRGVTPPRHRDPRRESPMRRDSRRESPRPQPRDARSQYRDSRRESPRAQRRDSRRESPRPQRRESLQSQRGESPQTRKTDETCQRRGSAATKRLDSPHRKGNQRDDSPSLRKIADNTNSRQNKSDTKPKRDCSPCQKEVLSKDASELQSKQRQQSPASRINRAALNEKPSPQYDVAQNKRTNRHGRHSDSRPGGKQNNGKENSQKEFMNNKRPAHPEHWPWEAFNRSGSDMRQSGMIPDGIRSRDNSLNRYYQGGSRRYDVPPHIRSPPGNRYYMSDYPNVGMPMPHPMNMNGRNAEIESQMSAMNINESMDDARHRWEIGQADFAGRDSFANIQAYIDERLKK